MKHKAADYLNWPNRFIEEIFKPELGVDAWNGRF